MLALAVLTFHAEEVTRAGQNLVEYPHHTREHLRSNVGIDLRVVIKVEGLFRAEDVFSEAHNLILVVLTGEETLLVRIVGPFFDTGTRAD